MSEVISQIKSKLDIVDIVSAYVQLKKAGNNYKGTCPFHSEKTASLMVSKELQIFKCFGCNEAGDIFKFIQKIEGVEFPQALKILAEKANVELPDNTFDPNDAKRKVIYELNSLAVNFFYNILTKHSQGADGLKYLKEKRKLSDATIKDFKLGFAPNSWDLLTQTLTKRGFDPNDMVLAGLTLPRKSGDGYIDKFANRIMFPLIDIDGKILGFTGRSMDGTEPKYLNTNETLVFHKGSFIYGMDKAKLAIKKSGAVFVEGNTDVIKPHQYGLKNVIAVSGTSLTSTQLRILSRYTKDVTFCFDADSAGDAAMRRAIEMAEKEDFNIKACLIPGKYKDIDELFDGEGETAKDIFTSAIPIYDFLLLSALKRNNKKDPIGKKSILNEISREFSKITNNVTLDHYVKKVAEELGIEESTVRGAFKHFGGTAYSSQAESSLTQTKHTDLLRQAQLYVLALIHRLGIDNAANLGYKLSEIPFYDKELSGILNKIHAPSATDTEKGIIEDILIWDFGDKEPTQKDLSAAITRLSDLITRKELTDITEKLKLAEMAKDTKQVEKLTTEFKNLSERLIHD